MGFFSRFFSFIPKFFNVALTIGSGRAKAKIAEVDSLTEEERALVNEAIDETVAEIKKSVDDR